MWVKGDLHIFHQTVVQLSFFQKNIFPFSQVEQLGCDNVLNEGIVKFLQKFGMISTSLQKQGDKAKNPIMRY